MLTVRVKIEIVRPDGVVIYGSERGEDCSNPKDVPTEIGKSLAKCLPPDVDRIAIIKEAEKAIGSL